jgi:hypothetical protein
VRVSPDQLVTIGRETRSVREWTDANGLDLALVRVRVHQGKSLEEALTKKRLTRSQARTRYADTQRYTLPSVGKVSAEFIPGRRKPRADRKPRRKVQ